MLTDGCNGGYRGALLASIDTILKGAGFPARV